MSIAKTYKRLWEILPRQQRREAVPLLGMMILVALIETAGVVSILPFIMVVSRPEILHQEGWMSTLYNSSGIESGQQFMFLLGVGVLLTLAIGNTLKALSTWMTNRFISYTSHTLSMNLMRAYLAREYEYFLTHHTTNLGKNVISEAQTVVGGAIQPALTILSRGAVGICLGALLVVTSWKIALIVVALFGGAYGLIFWFMKLFLARAGKDRFKYHQQRFHIATETFSGIKEIKLRGLESVYEQRLEVPSRRFARIQAVNQTITRIPRYGLELIAFGSVLSIILHLMSGEQRLEDALPLIALFAFAGYRMLPTIQEIFASFAKMRYTRAAVEALYHDLYLGTGTALPLKSVKPLPFRNSIRLKKVDFTYPAGDRSVLYQINLEIPKGSRVGFVGMTGSGKSTVIDLILGLLKPTNGEVLIDGRSLDTEKIIRRWQCQIGYVPQHIFLADDTISANIAFGVPSHEVDRAAVKRAAKIAQLHEFIETELSQGYDTPIGERGIRLSGGQRQRLGLARAFYTSPAILVLDEATSALDDETEDAVIQALDGVASDCTIIMIAHRLSTVKRCDILFRLENGRITDCGSFENLHREKAFAIN